MNKIQIWNMALGWVGTGSVASETERTPEAIQCGIYWDNARRQALRDYPWNFAQRRAWLAEVPMPVGWEEEYRKAYAVPADMLKAMKLKPEGRGEARFVMASDGQGKNVILTNCDRALLVYTADVEDVTRFEDLFAAMLARKLAAMLAVPILRNNAGKVNELEELYMRSIPKAMEADSGEGSEEEPMDSWIKARSL